MWGFGAPDNVGAATTETQYDWGFGDPVPAGWAFADVDWGFGDVAPENMFVVAVSTTALLPDDGGEVVRLTATWPALGPYRIKLFDHFTSTLVAQAKCPLRFDDRGKVVQRDHALDCFSNERIVTQGNRQHRLPGKYVYFVLPVLPVSKYDVELTWGANFANRLVMPMALEVIQRGRSQEQWAIRSTYPDLYSTGPRAPALEEPLEV